MYFFVYLFKRERKREREKGKEGRKEERKKGKKGRKKERKNILICCFTYLCLHWLILLRALTGDRTRKLGTML